MVMKLFKKKSKTPPGSVNEKKDEVIYSMTPRHGHAQDVFDENGIRQVAGCLPIDPINKRFLLVSSSGDPTVWVIPKGGWEKDETQKQAAMRETWEEAGVKGVITRHIGVFAEKTRGGVKAHHWIYEMEIKEVCKKFPEQKKRERRWFTYEEAMLVVKAHYIHDALSMSSLSPLVQKDGDELGEKKKKKKKKDKEKKQKAEGDDDDDDNDVDENGEKKKKKKKKNKDKENGDLAGEGENEDDELTAEEKKAKKEKKKKKKNKNKDDDDYVSEEEDVKEVRENELSSDGKIITEKPRLSDEKYLPMSTERYQQQLKQKERSPQSQSQVPPQPLSQQTQQLPRPVDPTVRPSQQLPPNYPPSQQQPSINPQQQSQPQYHRQQQQQQQPSYQPQQQHLHHQQQQQRPPHSSMYQQRPPAMMHPQQAQHQHPSYQTPPTQWQQYPPHQQYPQQFRPANGSSYPNHPQQQRPMGHPHPQAQHPGVGGGAAARGGQPPHIITTPQQQRQQADRGKILMEIGKDTSGLIPQRN